MKVKTLELLDGDTVESWEECGPARPLALGDIERAQLDGMVGGVKLA